MDFIAIQKTLDNLEEKALEKSVDIMKKVRDDLTNWVVRKNVVEDRNSKEVEKLQLKYMGDFRILWKGLLRDVYEAGQKQAGKVIKKKGYKTIEEVIGLKPAEAIKYFDEKAFWITGIVKEDVLNKSRGILLNGIKNGKTNKEVMFELDKLFNPYIDRQLVPEVVATPNRLETIVRTNFTDAYNQGLKQEFGKQDFVESYEWSAILDDRTSPYCRNMDGQIFKKDDPRFRVPPAHHQCRSVIVPITIDEKYTLSTRNPLTGRGEGF